MDITTSTTVVGQSTVLSQNASTAACGRTGMPVKTQSCKQMSNTKTHVTMMREYRLSSKKKDYQYDDDSSDDNKKPAVHGLRQNCTKTLYDRMKMSGMQLLSVSQVQQMIAEHTGGQHKVIVRNGQRVLIRPHIGMYSNVISSEDGQIITYVVRPKQNTYQHSLTVSPSTFDVITRSMARKR